MQELPHIYEITLFGLVIFLDRCLALCVMLMTQVTVTIVSFYFIFNS